MKIRLELVHPCREQVASYFSCLHSFRNQGFGEQLQSFIMQMWRPSACKLRDLADLAAQQAAVPPALHDITNNN